MTNEPSTSRPRRLPDNWVQKIFSTMQGHYGTRFLNMWCTGQLLSDGQDAGLVNAMNHWAEKLGGYVDHPHTIRKVLAALPPEPPTLPQFAEMLRLAYVPPETPALEHKLTEEDRQRNLERIKKISDMLSSKMTGATS